MSCSPSVDRRAILTLLDSRLTDTHPACGMNWPNLLPDMYDYLPRPDVVTAFHASSKTSKWVECNGHVSSSFWARTKPSVSLLPSILERNVPILLFSGMQDLICNHVGTERLIENLEWGNGKGFGNDTQQKDWFVDGRLAGTWTVDRNLTYVQVHNASHMVRFTSSSPSACKALSDHGCVFRSPSTSP